VISFFSGRGDLTPAAGLRRYQAVTQGVLEGLVERDGDVVDGARRGAGVELFALQQTA
jgi:hypothetical protein